MTPPDTSTTDTTIAHGRETVERQLRVARAMQRRCRMKASDLELPEPIVMADVVKILM
jgi:hypothetical protein